MKNGFHAFAFKRCSLYCYAMGMEAGNLSGMRTLRAMKPLKTINGKGLDTSLHVHVILQRSKHGFN